MAKYTNKINYDAIPQSKFEYWSEFCWKYDDVNIVNWIWSIIGKY